MNPIMTSKLAGVLSLILLSATYMMISFPEASADCSYVECNPDTKYPLGCGYGCHCIDYGDGNKCQTYDEEKGTRCLSHDHCIFRTTKDVVGYCYRVSGVTHGVCSTRPIKP